MAASLRIPPIRLRKDAPNLRTWQEEALAAWKNNQRRGVIHVTTGAGKTIFALHCIADASLRIPSLQIMIVVPTTALLDQWYTAVLSHFDIAESEICTYSGEVPYVQPRAINLLIINTARKLGESLLMGRPTMLIVDECHRAASVHNSKALKGSHAATLGLSATPFRPYDDRFEKVVVPALGEVIYQYDTTSAKRDGLISNYELVNVGVQFTDAERQRYARYSRQVAALTKRRTRGENVDDELELALIRRANSQKNALNRIGATVKLVEHIGRRRCIVFHESIQDADRILGELRARGSRVTAYHSRIELAMRRDNLRLFAEGRFDVLVTCRAADEGLDVPDAEVAIIASATRTLRQRIQRVGRVLRPSPNKSVATIYTIYLIGIEEERFVDELRTLDTSVSVRWMKATDDAASG